jgi:hypothetical protein
MTKSVSLRQLFAAGSVVVLAACSSDVPTSTMAPGSDGTANVAAQAQDRLEAAFQRSSPEVMAVAGTVFADNDERIGKLVIGIDNMRAAGAVRAAMARAGVAESDYVVELTQPIENMATLRDVMRPTRAGLQVHFTRYVCSLGMNVDHAGGRSFIINSHCTGKQGGVEGTTYAQPSRDIDPTVIATEVDDPLYLSGGSCPKGKKCRHSDASRALYSAGTASNRGEIALTTGINNGSLTLSGSVGFITSQDNTTKNFPVGMVVNKVGRTTGWTQGEVTRSCVNTSVSGSTVYLYCQTFVANPNGATVVSGGDSGSGVWTGSPSSATFVGLLWGGSSDNKQFVFSPLASIQQELGAVNAVR